MTHAPAPRSPRALTAIAAVLALGSTPLLIGTASAQEAAPLDVSPSAPAPAAQPAPATQPSATAPTAPVTTPAPVAQPTIVLPDVSQPVSTVPSVAAPPPATEAAAAPAPQRAATAEPRASRPAARTVATRTSAPAGQTTSAPASAPAPVADPAPGVARDATPIAGPAPFEAPARQAAPAQPAASAADASEETGVIAAGIGLLAVLGIGGAAYAMTRRRRVEDDPLTRDEIAPYEPVAREPAPVVAAPIHDTRAERDVSTARERAAAFAAPAGASLTAPVLERRAAPAADPRRDAMQGPVPMGEDRQALLDRMVAAEPDALNPFGSRKARLRRARLILQHREQLQTQGKPFDWRTYTPTSVRPADRGPAAVQPSSALRTPEFEPA